MREIDNEIPISEKESDEGSFILPAALERFDDFARLRVPGGWVVSLPTSAVFVEDPGHRWDPLPEDLPAVRVFVRTEGVSKETGAPGEREVDFEDLRPGDVFRLESPEGGDRSEGWRRARSLPYPTRGRGRTFTWGIRAEPLEEERDG